MPNIKRTTANKRVTRNLLTFLTENDFTTHVRRATTSNSTYIKMDYGANYSIRISDHRGNPKYDYRFNLMLGMTPEQVAVFRKHSHSPRYPRFFFAESEIEILKQTILLSFVEECKKGIYAERYHECLESFKRQAASNAMSFASTCEMHHQRLKMPHPVSSTKPTTKIRNTLQKSKERGPTASL